MTIKSWRFPGGFSFGDEISSGQILSLKMKHGLKHQLDQFIKDEKTYHWYLQWFSNS